MLLVLPIRLNKQYKQTYVWIKGPPKVGLWLHKHNALTDLPTFYQPIDDFASMVTMSFFNLQPFSVSQSAAIQSGHSTVNHIKSWNNLANSI